MLISEKAKTKPKSSYLHALLQVIGKGVAGEIFGEIGVLCNRPQPYTVRTTELSQILRLKRTSLMSIIQANMEDGRITMNNLFLVCIQSSRK